MKLLVSQKDQLYEFIQSTGLSPAQFEFAESSSLYTRGSIATSLNYINSDYYFRFENKQGRHSSLFSPGNEKFIEDQFPGAWDLQIRYFNNWLRNLVRELNSPNKWARLKTELDNLDFHFDYGEDKFTVQEFQDIQNRIGLLCSRLNSIPFEENQILALNQKLDFLIESAKEMKKFDWKSLFIGTIVSIIIQLNVTPENANLLWNLVKEVFNTYFLQ
jgi:hypothetical protein